jgi:hypothetical protein
LWASTTLYVITFLRGKALTPAPLPEGEGIESCAGSDVNSGFSYLHESLTSPSGRGPG